MWDLSLFGYFFPLHHHNKQGKHAISNEWNPLNVAIGKVRRRSSSLIAQLMLHRCIRLKGYTAFQTWITLWSPTTKCICNIQLATTTAWNFFFPFLGLTRQVYSSVTNNIKLAFNVIIKNRSLEVRKGLCIQPILFMKSTQPNLAHWLD